MKKSLLFSSIVAFLLTFVGCQKGDQGDVGPQGAAGPKGVQGTKGEAGATNANGMFVTDWLEVKGTDWKVAGPNTYFVTASWAPLTADIVSKGVVYTYFKGTSQANVVYPLPASNPDTGQRFYSIVSNINNKPAIEFYQGVTPPKSVLSTSLSYSFRIVVVAAAGGRMAHIDWNNYEEVKAALNIKD